MAERGVLQAGPLPEACNLGCMGFRIRVEG